MSLIWNKQQTGRAKCTTEEDTGGILDIYHGYMWLHSTAKRVKAQRLQPEACKNVFSRGFQGRFLTGVKVIRRLRPLSGDSQVSRFIYKELLDPLLAPCGVSSQPHDDAKGTRMDSPQGNSCKMTHGLLPIQCKGQATAYTQCCGVQPWTHDTAVLSRVR